MAKREARVIDINDKHHCGNIVMIIVDYTLSDDYNRRSDNNEYQSAVSKINSNRSNDYAELISSCL